MVKAVQLKNPPLEKQYITALKNQQEKNVLLKDAEIEQKTKELISANIELSFQNEENLKCTEELIIADKELIFQNKEKEKRAAELIIANKELDFQNKEKGKRAAELITANKKLAFQNKEKGERAAELLIANKKLSFENKEKEKRAAELLIANKKLLFENKEKGMRAAELIIANKELAFQNKEKEKRAAELLIANQKLLFENKEKGKRAAELIIANKELAFQNIEKEKRATELLVANSNLEQFAYIVSHNLRAPVANIIGAANTLNFSGLTSEDKHALSEGLKESVIRLDDVIKDLNRILEVKGNIDKTREKVHFSDLVEDIKIILKHQVGKDQIKIKYDFSGIDEILTLKSYLYSIFFNLICNSIKYRRQKIPCNIEIKSQVKKNKIALIFIDNGMGIDLQKRKEQVFGLYKRFHPGIEGKGIGLFIVKTQVEALGGKINIKSEVDKGTEFYIEFAI